MSTLTVLPLDAVHLRERPWRDFGNAFVVLDAAGKPAAACETQALADAVVAGAAAIDRVAALEAQNECARQAICFAMGIEAPTVDEALAALLQERADLNDRGSSVQS